MGLKSRKRNISYISTSVPKAANVPTALSESDSKTFSSDTNSDKPWKMKSPKQDNRHMCHAVKDRQAARLRPNRTTARRSLAFANARAASEVAKSFDATCEANELMPNESATETNKKMTKKTKKRMRSEKADGVAATDTSTSTGADDANDNTTNSLTKNSSSDTVEVPVSARGSTTADDASVSASANDTENELDKRLRLAARNASRLERQAYLKEQQKQKGKDEEKEKEALLLKQQKEHELMAFTPKTPLCLPPRSSPYSPGSRCRLPYPTKKYRGTPVTKNTNGTMEKVGATQPAGGPAVESPFGTGGWGLGYSSDVEDGGDDVGHADNERVTSFVARLQAAKCSVDVPARDKNIPPPLLCKETPSRETSSSKTSTSPQKTHVDEPYAVKSLSTPGCWEEDATSTTGTALLPLKDQDSSLRSAAINDKSQTDKKRKGQFIHVYRYTVIPPVVAGESNGSGAE
ncbi:hypothetical protein SPBR_00594 [Sporothrix brasiliensis 5110]|uniref:Uncharacterized protein n=1 Tax=Sporothrix brasiliensis 5110 TaxID=1398154 RepID=A0A0C2IVY3_9PEZI|nr:uncharacterized protein SPBR_00594 [Sporothrix brasiliensis 5110]KIH90955.1 hypothetical protein SPBR_00594 [Sporothrix brasiliensis 5110]